MSETWDLWIDAVAATGMSFGRSKVDAADAGDRVLVHAAPKVFSVTVRDDAGAVVASGESLERAQEGPMSWLVRDGDEIRLEEGWPTEEDIGCLVLLAGGEAGVLTSWWHADDQTSWRWGIEFFNHV